MAVNHKRDRNRRTEPCPIILAKPGKRLYCTLNGVDESTVSLTKKCNNLGVLTFEIFRFIDQNGQSVESNAYCDIEEYMELYCDGQWFVIAEPPTVMFDGWIEKKTVTAESYEIRLQQFMLNNFYINRGTEDSQEMIYATDHDKTKFYQVKFYDPREPKLSLLHLVLSHANVREWTIGYVDDITPSEVDGETFLPDEVSLFETEACSVYAFLTQQVSQAFSCIFVFDTCNMTINVFRAKSLGQNTNIVLAYRNVQNTLTKTRPNQMVTAFKVEGADGLTIDYVNFGSNIIMDYTFFMREPYMNKELVEKLEAWLAYREEQRPVYIKISKEYNKNLEVLSEIMNRLPADTTSNDWLGEKDVEKLKTGYTDSVAAIRGFEALYVDEEGNFDLEALKNSHDWPAYEQLMNYTIPVIVAALQAQGEPPEDYGSGNFLQNVNPVTFDRAWLIEGADTAEANPVQLEDAPCYGVTRGFQLKFTSSSSRAGFLQKNIDVMTDVYHVLSCYVKTVGASTVKLEYGDTGKDKTVETFNVTPGKWTRIYKAFRPKSRLVEIAFTASGSTGNEVIFAGVQLEMNEHPTQFGYYTQSEQILNAWETDWKLYGITELKNKIGVYTNSIDSLKQGGYAVSYSPLSKYSEDFHTQMYQKYNDFLRLREEAEAALAKRMEEYKEAERPELQEQREEISKNVEIERFGYVQTEFPPFTELELFIINSLYNEQTYTNEHILTTTLDDLADVVDKHKILYDDAVDHLYVESHAQYSYENDIDSIYALPEFEGFDGQLDVGNYLRVETDEGNFVKLRCTEITYNPCAWDMTMDLVFSDMVKYKAKYSDTAYLIENMNSSNKQQIVGGKSNDVTDYILSNGAIKKLFSNPLFQSMLGGATVGGSGSGGTGSGNITADKIITELIKADEAIIGKLTADTAFIKYLDATLVNAEKIIAGIIEADEAKFKELSAKLIEANEIYAEFATIKELFVNNEGVENLHVLNLTAKNVTISDAVIKELIAAKISVADLMTHSATAQLITLISADGKPTIAFQNSTQQFYDKNGNVRVQIGQDGNGNFNFIVRGEDGTTALYDQDGIHKEAIPNGTIVNDMLEIGTIGKDKLGFEIMEPNEFGGIDITQIYDGKGGLWGVQYESFRKEINDKLDDLDAKVKRIDLYSDAQVFIEDGGTVSPNVIKVYAITKGNTSVEHWYIDDVEQTNYVAPDKTYINIPHAYLNRDKKSIVIKATDSSGALYDVMSLYYIPAGDDGITVVVTSSNGNIFKENEGTTQTILECKVYKGVTEVEPNWYKWLKQENGIWGQVGTAATLAVNIAAMAVLENYKCQVDI